MSFSSFSVRRDRQEAFELDDLALGLEEVLGCPDVEIRLFDDGGGHLGSDELVPDEPVEVVFLFLEIGFDAVGREIEMGGTNGFVGVLGLFLVFKKMRVGRKVVGRIFCRDVGLGPGLRLVRDSERVPFSSPT